jgi:hypothetical protein
MILNEGDTYFDIFVKVYFRIRLNSCLLLLSKFFFPFNFHYFVNLIYCLCCVNLFYMILRNVSGIVLAVVSRTFSGIF